MTSQGFNFKPEEPNRPIFSGGASPPKIDTGFNNSYAATPANQETEEVKSSDDYDNE